MSSKEKAWYEDEKLKSLYVKAQSNAFRGYTAPVISPKTTWIGTNSLTDFINHLGAYLDEDEKRVLIVVDKDLRRMGEKVADKMRKMKQIDSKIFDQVYPEVPKYSIKDGVKACEEYEPKVIIAVGGGSTIDTAKMIFLLYEQPNINFNTMMAPSFLGLRKKVHLFVAIPTTSGTGSEATFVSVVTDTDRYPPKKTSVVLYELCPDFVVLHPDFVKGMPPWLTTGTGMDAMAHAMGTYMIIMSSFYNDMHNRKAIELILKYLPRAVKRGNDMEAREKMQIAAWLATSSIAGIEHGFGQSFGAIFHVHHGICVALFLCASIAYQSKVTNRFLDLAKLFKVKRSGIQKDEILKELLEKLQKFMKKIECPLSIEDLKDPSISYEEYTTKMDYLIEYAFNDYCTLSSTRPLDKKSIKKIFEIAYENKIEDLMELYYK
jgi:hypothetical protein